VHIALANGPSRRKYKMRVCVLCVYLYILTRYSCTGTPHAGPQVLGKTIFKRPADVSISNISINLTLHYILYYYCPSVRIRLSRLFKGPSRVDYPPSRFDSLKSTRVPLYRHSAVANTLGVKTFYLANFFNVNFCNTGLYYTCYAICHSLY